MSIIGFDVHTCNGSGRCFVTTFIEGLACEDVHPEHSCSHASCCPSGHEGQGCCDDHHHDGNMTVLKASSCCSDDYQVLQLTGTIPADDQRGNDFLSFGKIFNVVLHSTDVKTMPVHSPIIAYLYEPASGHKFSCDPQAALSVWRI